MKINSSQSVGASSSSSSFQSFVEVSGDQTLNQANRPKQSGFKRKLQVVGQRLRGGLALVVSGLKSNKNNRVSIPNEVDSAGKVGRQSVDFGRLVRLPELHKEAEDILGGNDLAQLKNFKSKIDKEIEYLQSIAINFESDGEGNKYVKGEIETGGKSLKDLSRKCEAYLVPEKDLIQHTLDRSRSDEVYFMRILSTEGSQLNKVWTNAAQKAYTYDTAIFLREFARVINVGVTTEPQEYLTLKGYLDQLYDALIEGLYSGDDSNLVNLENFADKVLKAGSKDEINVSGGEKKRVIDGLKLLRSLYQEKGLNNQDSASGSSQRNSKEQSNKDLDSLVSVDLSEIDFSDESSVATVKSSDSIDDSVFKAIDNVLEGCDDIVKEIYVTFVRNMNTNGKLQESLQEQNRGDLTV
ncbi:hypothetical protein [Microbulbifer sp. TRSA007]|uniref:hypothetical protein n=1 Tax=Microbulbifer sp. TRSA007 TaxID=3243384 RepID=UPI004039AC9E